jgi:D-alanyl-D-alanine carboxypeptidase (penicillin-binding protein 5/6)
MFSALASVFLFGIVPATPPPAPPKSLPGIEVLSIAAPSSLGTRFTVSGVSASGVLLMDALSGDTIYAVAPDTRRPMASLTKIMTALLTLEKHELSKTVTVPLIADNIGGSSVHLVAGEHFSVHSMLKSLLLHSANDVAYALAVFNGRSVGAFVRMMNERATSLGLLDTHFANPAGLDNPEQYSTPRDLAWLTMAALKHEHFRTIVQTRTARISSYENRTFDVKNTNEMLHYNEDVYGIKTGTTNAAGECLILLFTERDRPYILVLLGSKERYTDALRILKALHDATP